jgi:hypothetical protein
MSLTGEGGILQAYYSQTSYGCLTKDYIVS